MHIDYIRAFSNSSAATAITLQTASSPDGAMTTDLHGATTGNGTVTNPGTLVLHVSEDAWNGDAQFTVMVDGVRLGDVYSTTASHALGQWQDITLTGNFPTSGAHTVSVNFINDGWGGTAATDRNLYVQSIDLNGEHILGSSANNTAANGSASVDPTAAVMQVNGTATFSALGIPNDTVTSDTSYTLSAGVFDLTLSGTAAINGSGNALDNTITGNSGDNILDGGAGNDTMIGGTGNDTYIVDSPLDMITEAPNQGADWVYASTSYTLPANVENLTLTGAGTWSGTGNASDNAIFGNGWNNVLDGGLGADFMAGGRGDDAYYVDNASDVVYEKPGEGGDTVVTTVNYQLFAGSEVEALVLLDAGGAINGVGSDTANLIQGNNFDNVIVGRGGNDLLSGRGGADRFIFGTGDGHDTITDYNHTEGDYLDIRITGYTTATQILATAHDNGTSTTIQFNAHDAITLTGIHADQLTAADFLIIPPGV
jgi:serralysin